MPYMKEEIITLRNTLNHWIVRVENKRQMTKENDVEELERLKHFTMRFSGGVEWCEKYLRIEIDITKLIYELAKYNVEYMYFKIRDHFNAAKGHTYVPCNNLGKFLNMFFHSCISKHMFFILQMFIEAVVCFLNVSIRCELV